jgi:hypothetical protein
VSLRKPWNLSTSTWEIFSLALMTKSASAGDSCGPAGLDDWGWRKYEAMGWNVIHLSLSCAAFFGEGPPTYLWARKEFHGMITITTEMIHLGS